MTRFHFKCRDFNLRMMEIVAGFSFACILTLAFIGPLSVCQKISLCLFGITLSTTVMVRLEIDDPEIEKHIGYNPKQISILRNLISGGILTGVIGFAFLLWSISPLATILSIVVIVPIETVFTKWESERKQLEANSPTPPSNP